MDIAGRVISGSALDQDTYTALARTPLEDLFSLMAGADVIRQAFFQNTVHLCTICNGKSGRCSENCSFCSQSGYATADIDVYPLLPESELQKGAVAAMTSGVHRYSIVTSGRGLSDPEVQQIADAIAGLQPAPLSFCVSLGILGPDAFKTLKAAGVTRYHHNLETSRSHFSNICTTHSFQDRVDTIKAAQKAGLSVCAGGLFGIGETMEQVLEMALELKTLDVDAVPVNFLTPISGTPLAGQKNLTPLRCLKIISLIRYVLPQKDILVCGGRMGNLKLLHPMIFPAGASGLMTGRYLTTDGNQLEEDLEMIQQVGFELRR